MPDLILYAPAHGYSDDDPIYVSWLDGYYYVASKDTDSFKLAFTSGGSTYVQYSETVTSGYVREYDPAAVTSTVTGLSHLEGQSVYVMSGGDIHGVFTVTNGTITFNSALVNFQIGRPYALKVRTMRLSAPQSPDGVQARVKRINETVVRTIKSIYGSAGQEYDGTEYTDELNSEYDDESGDYTVLTKGGFSSDCYTIVKSDDPFPFTALAVIISFSVDE